MEGQHGDPYDQVQGRTAQESYDVVVNRQRGADEPGQSYDVVVDRRGRQ